MRHKTQEITENNLIVVAHLKEHSLSLNLKTKQERYRLGKRRFLYTNWSKTNPCALAKTVFPRN